MHSKISPKSCPLAVKSPTQSLDYRANIYHIHLNTLGFHGYGEEISQIYPYPFLSNKYFLLRYPSSILSFYSLKPTFLAAALFENFKNSSKDLLQQSFESSILPSSREEMAINFVVPEVNSIPPFFFFLLYFYISAILFTEYIFPLLCFFPILSTSKPFRNWLRKW